MVSPRISRALRRIRPSLIKMSSPGRTSVVRGGQSTLACSAFPSIIWVVRQKGSSGRDLTWRLTEHSQTDLRSLQVLQDSEWPAEVAVYLFHGGNRGKAFFFRTVREIDPKDIHSAFGEGPDPLLGIRRWSECGDDLGTFDVRVVRHVFLHRQGTDGLSLIHDTPVLSGTNEKEPHTSVRGPNLA